MDEMPLCQCLRMCHTPRVLWRVILRVTRNVVNTHGHASCCTHLCPVRVRAESQWPLRDKASTAAP